MLHRKPRRLSLIDGELIARIGLIAFAVAALGAGLAMMWDKSSARAEKLAPSRWIELEVPVPALSVSAFSAPTIGEFMPTEGCPIRGKASVAPHAACICAEQGGEPVKAGSGVECWKRLPLGGPFTHELLWELVAD